MELRQGLQSRTKILHWAGKYDTNYDIGMKNLVTIVEERANLPQSERYLTQSELIEVAKWKVHKKRNTIRNVIRNDDTDVKELTAVALKAPLNKSMHYLCNRRPQYERGLYGVRIPVGSAILHWFHADRYPIWDQHAIWSVQLDESEYENQFVRWTAYVRFCRDRAEEYEVNMRILDRALLKYGKHHSRSC